MLKTLGKDNYMKDGREGTSRRIGDIRARISSLGIEAILFLDMVNIRYLSGFTGSDGVLLVGKERVTLLVDGRY